MVVAVQRPRRESDLDTVLKGLQVVGGVLNIKDQLGAAERLKAQQDRQATLDARAQEKHELDVESAGLAKSAVERKLAKEERFAAGKLSPMEAQQEGLVESPKGLAGGITITDPETGLARTMVPKSQIESRQRSEALAEQRQFNNEMKLINLEMKKSQNEEKRRKLKNTAIEKLTNNFKKDGVPEMHAALRELDDLLDIDGDDDIDGVGATAKLPDLMVSNKGTNIRKKLANLFNVILKTRSGGAVTPQEAQRLVDELKGQMGSDLDIRQGLRNVRSGLRANIENRETGIDPEVLSAYRERAKSISSSDNLFKEISRDDARAIAKDELGFSNDDYQAELRRRGLVPNTAEK